MLTKDTLDLIQWAKTNAKLGDRVSMTAEELLVIDKHIEDLNKIILRYAKEYPHLEIYVDAADLIRKTGKE